MKYRKLDQRGDVSVELVSGKKIGKDAQDRIVVMYSKPTDSEVEMLNAFAQEATTPTLVDKISRFGDKKKGVLVFTGPSEALATMMSRFMELQAHKVKNGASFFIEFRKDGSTAIKAAKSKKLEQVSVDSIKEIWHVEAGARGCGEAISASETMAEKLDGGK